MIFVRGPASNVVLTPQRCDPLGVALHLFLTAVSAQAFVWLDLLLMGAVFSYARFGDVRLVSYSFGLHYLAALTVSML